MEELKIMSNLLEFEDKIKKMREFEQLFDALEVIYPHSTSHSKMVDKCFMLWDDYVKYVAKEFDIDVEWLFWFALETKYGTQAEEIEFNDQNFVIDGVVSFYECFSG